MVEKAGIISRLQKKIGFAMLILAKSKRIKNSFNNRTREARRVRTPEEISNDRAGRASCRGPMKIAVLGIRGFPHVLGGPETHCEHLYPRLVERGCEVVVFCRKPYIDPAIHEYNGVTLTHLACLKHKYLEAFLHTLIGIFAAKKEHPDIIHIHAIGPSLFIPLARLLGFKVVMTNHGPDYERKKWGKLAKTVLRLGEMLGSKWADQVICISQSIADNVRRKYRREVSYIPNGVIIPRSSQTDTALKKYRLEKGKYILAVGRFVPEKGFHDLMDAFNMFQSSGDKRRASDFKLVVVGSALHEDKYSLDLKKKARQNPNIILTGFLSGEALRALYSNAQLFVLPSYYEGLPIVLLEAMSFGLPYIVSDIKAHTEMNLPTDKFFKAGDVNGMAQKIREFVDKPLSEDEKRNQISMIAARYDWNNIANRTLGVYFQIVH